MIDEDGPNTPDPVKQSMPKLKIKRYPVRLHLGKPSTNGHHRNGRA